MSFAGNLEDLAIVDVIQLLHSTRKTGTLCVTSEKGRSQIVFKNGYIVCANHYNSSIRIGKILVEMEAMTEAALEEALAEQKTLLPDHQPLIGLLIEKGFIEKELAYKGLECLIEMTIVEMVSWQKGTFTLDVDSIEVNDEYRYIPEKLQQEMNFDTQLVLMDALRIYDEKRAAGIDTSNLSEDYEPNTESDSDIPQPEKTTEQVSSASVDLSADLLGLEAIDQLDTLIPETFTGLEAFDPSEIHRQKVRELLPDFSSNQREDLVSYLTEKSNISDNQEKIEQEPGEAIIFFSCDELVQHGIMSTCKHAGIPVFTVSSPQELENRIFQGLERELTPSLVFDAPVSTQEGFTREEITALRQQMAQHFPQLKIVQIASPVDYLYALQALTAGADAVIPRSIAENRRDSFIGDFIQFLESFPSFIHGQLNQRATQKDIETAELLKELRQMESAAEIAFFLLTQTSKVFERSITLILRQDELQAEKSFGVEADRNEGPSDPLRFKVSLDEESLLTRVIASGELFYGAVDDQQVRESIFGEISAPNKSKVLLLPLVAGGRTIALIYADFGLSSVRTVDTDKLENLAWVAGLALDRVLRSRNK